MKEVKYSRYDAKKHEEESIEELKSEPDMDGLNNSDMDLEQYTQGRENQIIQDILDETNKNEGGSRYGGNVNGNGNKLEDKDKFTLSSRNKEEEPIRGLSRTRSS